MNNIITQEMRYRQSLIKYAYAHGVTKAAIKYKTNRQYIYRWMRRYDGTLESLRNISTRPHHHPNQHKENEIKLIKDMYLKNKTDGLVVFWVKLTQRGYKRNVASLYRVMRKMGYYRKKLESTKDRKPKKYEDMNYPGERVQIDVKYVPMSCLSKELQEMGERYYQYTALDEKTRYRILWYSNEHSTYASAKFMQYLLKTAPFKIECVQTDNGFEFTNRLNRNRDVETIFEKVLRMNGIKHKIIKPYTPRHNGKVERSHRKDQEYFYDRNIFSSLEDLKEKGAKWSIKSNDFPSRPLNWKSPKNVLKSCLGVSRLKSYI